MAALQNTMAHGVARLSPKFSRDKMRWLSLGQSEAGFWQRNLFDVQDLQRAASSGSAAPDSAQAAPSQHNSRLAWYGVPEAACRELLNPGSMQVVVHSLTTLAQLHHAQVAGSFSRLLVLLDHHLAALNS